MSNPDPGCSARVGSGTTLPATLGFRELSIFHKGSRGGWKGKMKEENLVKKFRLRISPKIPSNVPNIHSIFGIKM